MTNPPEKKTDRVREYGEVFTPQWLIDDVLSMMPSYCLYNPHSRILDPACGDGRFLSTILKGKLKRLKSYVDIEQTAANRAIACISSIHGIDILRDNVEAARERQRGVFIAEMTRLYPFVDVQALIQPVDVILESVIIKGDTLKPNFLLTEWDVHWLDGEMKKRVFNGADVLALEDDLFNQELKPVLEEITHWSKL